MLKATTMKITDIRIDGFGVWNDLKLSGLSSRLTAFYGANEAGKTTLMQFTRSVLYGMSAERRRRYLPPVNGGRPGGSLGLLDDQQRFDVSRIADRGADDVGLVQISTSDGQLTGDRLLRESLHEIDEATYNNIFAIGLSEIQTLGTLEGSQAAEWLYRLTSGLDRVSLYDVIQNLRQTRLELLNGNDRQSRIDQLVTQREVLRGEIQQLAQRNRQWSQLSVRIQELDGQIAEQEAIVRDCQQRARTIEIAVGLKPNWRKRAKITSQLKQHEGSLQIPDDGLERLDALNRKIEDHQREADILKGQRQQLKEESDRLDVNTLLVKNACRIDALGEQRDWLQSLETKIEDLQAEADEFDQRLENEQERLGRALGIADREHLKVVSNADIESLQPQVKELRNAQKRVEQAQQEVDALAESERSLKVKVESAIIGGESHGLPMDVREASDLVGKLRSRLKVEQRIEQARNHEMDLEQQSHDLLEDQVIPLSTFNWMLAGVVLSGLMIGTWLWLPNNPFGNAAGILLFLSFGMLAFSFVFKFFAEDSAADKLDACQRQLDVVARQIKEAEREKKKLDAGLPITDGSVLIRLQAAERHLAELENVLPVEAQRKQAGHEVSTAESRLTEAKVHLEKVLKTWRTKLVSLGFSENLDPQRFLTVTERYETLSDLEDRAKLRREDAAARQREYDTLTRRIKDLAEEVDCLLVSEEVEVDEEGEEYEVEVSTLDQLEHLVSQRQRQLSEVQRRKDLSKRAKQLKADETKHRRSVTGLKRRRDALFQAVDCEDEPSYRRLAEEQEQRLKLKTQRQAVSREIAAAIGQHGTEEMFADLLSPAQVDQLEAMWETASAELEKQQQTLTEIAGRRGALRHEQKTLAEDRSLAERQLELSQVEKRLAEARETWREHATVNRVLERIRSEYEQNRQPETLAVASRYMDQLTGGEYKRIWTPLADDILLVENAAGESLTVDVLSRGTREQLFLSVRLALVANFASRGIKLPMVLDDILVNFDAVRAQRAAQVLCDFAAGGHQLLIFTCHEHMWQMFKSLDADCRRLPSRTGEVMAEPDPIVVDVEPEVVEEVVETIVEAMPKPKPKKKRKPKPQPVVETPTPEPEPPLFYDYPFVERIEEVTEVVEQPVTTPAQVVETTYAWTTPEPEVEIPVTQPQADNALAYILDAEGESAPDDGVYYQRVYRDHLEPRRA